MAQKPVFWGVGDSVKYGEGTTPLSIPTQALVLGNKMAFSKSGEIPLGFTQISSIQLRYRRTGTGNLYLKFASSHTSATTGSTPTEDVDSYTEYAVASADNAIANITVPASAYNGLTGMSAGDVLSLAVYRDDSIATDTYTTDLDVLGFSIIFTTGTDAEASTGDRSKRILGKVLLTLGTDMAKMAKTNFHVPEAVIYSVMGEYATKIAEETFCLETSSNLTVTSSAGSEPTGFLRLKLIELDSDLYIQPKEVDLVDYDIIVRNNYTDPIQTPLYYKRWNGTITFHPAVATDTYPIYWYSRPTTTPSSTTDPETPSQYDKAIEFGTISEIAPMVGRQDLMRLYIDRYEQELNTIAMNKGRTSTVELEVLYHGVNNFIKPILEH